MAALGAANVEVVSTDERGVSTGVDRGPYRDMLLVVSIFALGLLLVFLCATVHSRRGFGFDFIYFYASGQAMRLYPPIRLYDPTLQQSLYQALNPFPGTYGPFPYPPTVALLFSPITIFPIGVAFRVWQGITLLLYGCGVFLLANRLFSAREAWLILPIALAFAPFLIEDWTGGQFSICAFCGLTLAVYAQKNGRDLGTGAALALLAYKPQLLILLVPCLVLIRRWNIPLGFALTLSALFLATTAFTGWQTWGAYASYLLHGAHTLQNGRYWDHYADGSAFFSLLIGSHAAPLLLGISGLLILPFLWKAACSQFTDIAMLLSLVMTWTLWLNVYTPIYDTILMVPIAIVFARNASATNRGLFAACAVFLFASSWLSYAALRVIHLQLISVAIVAFGIAQFRWAGARLSDESVVPTAAAASARSL